MGSQYLRDTRARERERERGIIATRFMIYRYARVFAIDRARADSPC